MAHCHTEAAPVPAAALPQRIALATAPPAPCVFHLNVDIREADMSYVFSPAPVACVPVTGCSELFPVHRIYCVGRN